MKARILRKRERISPSGHVEWFGEVQFSDKKQIYGFTWKKTDWYRFGTGASPWERSERDQCVTLRTPEVKSKDPLSTNPRRPHSRKISESKERRQALLEALIELELYWDAMDV